jgi:hypothetical protein
MRSALLGVRLDEALGLDAQALREIYYCALLAYVGCTSEIGLARQLFGDGAAAASSVFNAVGQQAGRATR